MCKRTIVFVAGYLAVQCGRAKASRKGWFKMADQLNVESLDTAVDPNFDYMFKTLIVGNSGVGKTAFLVRYTDDQYVPTFVSTVGIDFKVKTLIR